MIKKNIYCSAWVRHIRTCPKTLKNLHDSSLEILNQMQ
ncbi:SLEI domain protein, PF07620 family [Leptospira interrogans str. UI 08452]|nr:SLEI domain protein, PF07620 family [Leptospira interrogans str. UI 08452]EMN80533.1 SLEI domain protein, PF07620 family [Leptospira interrogans serovar Grippotyphosa str. UI 12764]